MCIDRASVQTHVPNKIWKNHHHHHTNARVKDCFFFSLEKSNFNHSAFCSPENLCKLVWISIFAHLLLLWYTRHHGTSENFNGNSGEWEIILLSILHKSTTTKEKNWKNEDGEMTYKAIFAHCRIYRISIIFENVSFSIWGDFFFSYTYYICMFQQQ